MFQCTLEDKLVEEDSNATDNGVSISDDMISNWEYEIASTGSDITSEGVKLQVIFSCECEYLVADDFALNGKTAWGVYWNCQCNSSSCVNLLKSFCYFVCPKVNYGNYRSCLITPWTLITGIIEPRYFRWSFPIIYMIQREYYKILKIIDTKIYATRLLDSKL